MNFNFDDHVERRGTNSLKYDFAVERGKPDDILPLWVADMDFKTPPCVTEALQRAVRHGIFGYSQSGQEYSDAVKDWFFRYFDWDIKKEWLVETPGVVFAICMAIRALTNEGDTVLIQPPVYYPFRESVLANGRKLVNNQLVFISGDYSIDFEDFEKKITEQNVKLFILCSPHNPVGRVWTREELVRLGDICVEHGVFVVCDEIHADFVYRGFKHQVFANLKPEFSDIAVTCTSPSKTFNLAGLQAANIFASNRVIREKLLCEIDKTGYSQLNGMGLAACRAAYEGGRLWFEQLKEYLGGNLSFLRGFLNRELPQIKLVEPQGTYLVWLDCHGLGLEAQKLDDFITNKAKLWLDSGTVFGPGGSGFERINIACQRSTVEEALVRLKKAINSL